MSQLTLYKAETEVTARPLPQPLAIEWRGWPHAGKVTARQEPRPTGWVKLPFNPIQSPTKSNQIKPNQTKAGPQPSQKPGGRRPPLAGVIGGTDLHEHQRQFYHSIHSTTTHYVKSVQSSHDEKFEKNKREPRKRGDPVRISHGEEFEERKDIMSHKGKIARLPLAIREQLNRRLQDGEIGRDLVVWLNSAPAVQAVW